MSFFKKTINKLRAFPEYHDTDVALSDAIRDAQKKISIFNQAQGSPFSEFARKQPDTLVDVLNRLDEKIKLVFKTDNTTNEAIPTLKIELSKLRPLNDDISGKRKLRDNLKEKMDKSIKNAERLQSKLEQLRIKTPQSPEIGKVQAEYAVACRTRENAIASYNEKAEAIKTEDVEYKKQLFKTILNGFGLYSVARGQGCLPSVQIGKSIADLGRAILPYTDPGIGALKTEIQVLKTQGVE